MAACAANSRPALPAPMLVSPSDGTAFRTYPRTLTMQWMPVPGASGYGVEVDYFHALGWNSEMRGGTAYVFRNLPKPTHTMVFVGDQPGRWRVWAVDPKGRPGIKSEWRGFTWDTKPSRPTPPAMPGPDGVIPPRAVYSPPPPYAPAALKARVSGNVMLRMTVGDDGLVKDAVVIQSLHPDLDEAAVRTAKMWRFEPARKDGRPVAATVTVEMTFRVQ